MYSVQLKTVQVSKKKKKKGFSFLSVALAADRNILRWKNLLAVDQ